MKKIVSLLCALTLLLLVCSCGSDTQQSKVTTVRVNEVAHSVFYAPQYVAMKKGIKWKRIGRVVELWKHLFIRYFRP